MVVYESRDPDVEMCRWLMDGAPMGLAADIIPGGLFPTVEPSPAISVATLDRLPMRERNHPSFYECHGQGHPPAAGLLQEHIDKRVLLLVSVH